MITIIDFWTIPIYIQVCEKENVLGTLPYSKEPNVICLICNQTPTYCYIVNVYKIKL